MGEHVVDRTGEVTFTKLGSKATIINYPNRKNIDILYQKEWNGHVFEYIAKHKNYADFSRINTLCSPYDSGILYGYITTLKYPGCPGIKSDEYRVWANMMNKYTENVSFKWRYFKNFVKWYNKQKKLYPEGTKLYMCHYKVNGKFIGESSMILVPLDVKNLISRQQTKLHYRIGCNNKLYALMSKGTTYRSVLIDKINDTKKVSKNTDDIKHAVFEMYKQKILNKKLPEKIEKRLLKYNPFSNSLKRINKKYA